jgi:hypothetical protein
MTETSLQRRFCVHDVHEAANQAHVVEGLTFEDAALHFVEDFHPSVEDDEVSLSIEDIETGERQCLRIDLESGLAQPCD